MLNNNKRINMISSKKIINCIYKLYTLIFKVGKGEGRGEGGGGWGRRWRRGVGRGGLPVRTWTKDGLGVLFIKITC